MKTETCYSVQETKDFFIFNSEHNRDGTPLAARIARNIAQKFLLENISIIKDGCVRYFQIKNIGYSVHEIRLRPWRKEITYLCSEWET